MSSGNVNQRSFVEDLLWSVLKEVSVNLFRPLENPNSQRSELRTNQQILDI